MDGILIKCKNCDEQFQGKFCFNCGQSAETYKISHKFLGKELRTTFLRYDLVFIKMVWALFINPGKIIKDYLKGKRVDKARPFSYLLLNCGIYIILLKYFNVDFLSDSIEGFDMQKTNQILVQQYANIQLINLPIFAAVSLLVWGGKGYNFFEFIVIHAYIAGQRILIGSLLIPFHAMTKDPHTIHILNHTAFFLGLLVLVNASLGLFSHRGRVVIVLKTLLLQLLVIIILAPLLLYMLGYLVK